LENNKIYEGIYYEAGTVLYNDRLIRIGNQFIAEDIDKPITEMSEEEWILKSKFLMQEFEEKVGE
jgi:hypothetical protein